MTILAPSDVERLRANVNRFGNRATLGPAVPVSYIGGPLDGLRGRVDAYAARCAYLGWCIVTATGPVSALYTPSGEPGQWTFSELEAGPQ